jgi:CBS domain-containing protein
MKVEDIMTRDVRSCAPEESLSSAAQIMWEVDCGAVPVVDTERRVIGIITDRDICMASHLQGVPLGDASVNSSMARDIKCCGPHDSPATVQALMQQHKIRRVPVVDADRRLIGIVRWSLQHPIRRFPLVFPYSWGGSDAPAAGSGNYYLFLTPP